MKQLLIVSASAVVTFVSVWFAVEKVFPDVSSSDRLTTSIVLGLSAGLISSLIYWISKA